MLEIDTVLFEENICLDLKAHTKDEAIREMTHILYENKVIEDQEIFIQEIYKRESEGVTGIGNGIAIPHGRSDTVKKSVIAIGRSKNDLKWESFDEIPVTCLIMFAIRDVDISQHILLLSRVAELLLDDDVIDILHHGKNANEIMKLFRR